MIEFREILLQTLSNVDEKVVRGMSTHWKGKNILHFSVSKKHVALHPGKEALEVFSQELESFEQGKAYLQFSFDQELICKIASWCLEKYGNKKVENL